MAGTSRFPIRMSPGNGVLFRVLLILPSQSYVELTGDTLRVRLGWVFSARIPRRMITAARPGRRPTIPLTAGAHGWRNRWLVNGAPDGIVDVELSGKAGAFVMGLPIRLKVLSVSLVDPDGFLAAVNRQ
ncbi:MAG TPA: hypothetical protein VHL53_12280 [Acidimicrobiia bacterium]|nr:hypothetical protein [Acidimicrobiia bacterium]